MKEKCKDCGRAQCICLTKERFVELTILWFKKYRTIDTKQLQVYATYYNKYWKTSTAAMFVDLSCDRCIWTAIRESMAKVVSEGLYCNDCNKQICECKINCFTNYEKEPTAFCNSQYRLEHVDSMKKETVEDEVIKDKGANPGRNSRKKTKTK